MDAILSNYLALALLLVSLIPAERVRSGSDWTDWRGPARDGISRERGLPERWSPKGENLV